MRLLKPLPAVIGKEAGYTVDTPMDNLRSPVSLTACLWTAVSGCSKSHRHMGENANSKQDSNPGDSVNHFYLDVDQSGSLTALIQISHIFE